MAAAAYLAQQTEEAPDAAHDAHDEHAHDEHGHDEHGHEAEYLPSLNPKPSFWPIILSMVLLLVPTGTLLILWGGELVSRLGWLVLAAGAVLALIPSMGWFHSVIVDKWEGHFGYEAQGNDLALGTKLFFLSEIAIFGSLFAYFFVQQARAIHNPEVGWPLPGTPPIDVGLPMLGLLILVISSVTCEIAHKALIKGKRGQCKDWMIVTMVLGFIFLFIQGWEWGYMIQRDGFTVGTNWFGTLFFALTGFHGLHVMTGLMLLLIVYARLEIGHLHSKRHFSMLAASWYWHLVDVVWIFVFAFIYCDVTGSLFGGH